MSDTVLSGSCLCGEVNYTVTGEEQRFFHCHCQRCRKATGAGHSSNLFVQGSLEWNSGEELVTTYKLPDAERFANTFCRECGGRVPIFIGDYGMVFVPAGSLDDEPGLQPQARLFAGSRAGWSCEDTELPVFEEYPG